MSCEASINLRTCPRQCGIFPQPVTTRAAKAGQFTREFLCFVNTEFPSGNDIINHFAAMNVLRGGAGLRSLGSPSRLLLPIRRYRGKRIPSLLLVPPRLRLCRDGCCHPHEGPVLLNPAKVYTRMSEFYSP